MTARRETLRFKFPRNFLPRLGIQRQLAPSCRCSCVEMPRFRFLKRRSSRMTSSYLAEAPLHRRVSQIARTR